MPLNNKAKPRRKVSTGRGKSGAMRCIELPRSLSAKHLAELLGVSSIDVIKQLMRKGIMASINQAIDYNAASSIAASFGYETREEAVTPLPSTLLRRQREYHAGEEAGAEQSRPPVVTVMGHVDHGKTLLLDAIRKANVVAAEAGGITQHIGAYQVEVDGRRITFLDTPGHEAFTAMRARGAQITDIAVLVVAADDGVMPQTVEAINHCRAAGVPIIVAINKMDQLNANPERVKQQVADHDLLIEEWGGDVVCVPISAKTKEGIPELLESILIVAEMAELKANPQFPAEGVIVEAGLDKTRGPLATVLIQTGTLKVGDIGVAGICWGRIKALFSDRGKRVQSAGPSTPVKVLGLNGVPQAGDVFTVLPSKREAKVVIHEREEEKRGQLERRSNAPILTQVGTEGLKGLNIVLKTDVQGSIEPIKASLEQLKGEQAEVKIIHAGSGSITEGDVLLALASRGIVVGFNAKAEPGARQLAELEGVDIHCYDVIYNLTDDIRKALQGMLEPTYAEVIEGHAEVRSLFPMGRRGTVAGVYVTDGKVNRGALVRVIRNGKLMCQSAIGSLRRFKEDVKEVGTGFECGIAIEGYGDFQIGDIIEFYQMERKETGE
jgi:translation initiation factor IF-2